MDLKLDSFFEFSSDLQCVFGADWNAIVANGSFEWVVGFSGEELTKHSLNSFIHEDDRQNTSNSLSGLGEAGQVEFDSRIVSKDGTNYWMRITVYKSEGNPLFYVSMRDISKVREIENQLKLNLREIAHERAQDEAMLTSIGDGVIGVDDKGDVKFMNPQAARMLGVKVEEVKGKQYLKVAKLVGDDSVEIPVKNRPVHLALFTARMVTSRDWSYLRPDGSKFPVAITASPVKLNTQVVGGVVVFRDITHEREVDRMKTEFISLASHQLRTPLSAMKWYSEMLLGGDIGPITSEQREIISNIYLSNQRMIELVSSLLNISRIESGRIIIDPVPTDLKALIEEVVVDLAPKLKEKKHRLAVSVHPDLGPVKLDPKLVRHVYMNLLTNAIKYTKEGGDITVTVSRSGGNLISQVSDNGYGIPTEEQHNIFQKFFRAENIVKVETDGSGLGLYLTKAIVESSGGKIWFESSENKGTTFWFSLPIGGVVQKQGEVSLDS